MTDIDWQVVAELELTAADHAALATLLARYFPARAHVYRDGRSWHSARPELRVIARSGDRPVAHLGVLRRVVRVGGHDLLVADVGLVGTDPDLQGTGLGTALLGRTAAALRELAVPFGLLTTSEDLVGFYARGGWARVPAGTTRMLAPDGSIEHWSGPALVLPVERPLSAWPPGPIDRNGYEV